MNDQQLYEEFCRNGRAALDARNKCIGLLPEIFKRKIYLDKGFASIHEFAAKIAGLSHEQVNRVLNLERRFEDRPILRDALVRGEVSINKLQRVVSIATIENQQQILENVKNLSLRAVETMVRDFKNVNVDEGVPGSTQSEMFSGNGQDSEIIFEQEVKEQLLEMQRKGIDLSAALRKFLQNYREEIEEEKLQIGEKIQVAEETGRYVPIVARKILWKEFGEKCSVPGCNQDYFEIHHLIPYAILKKHDPRLMVQLCKEHHEITHSINLKLGKEKQMHFSLGAG